MKKNSLIKALAVTAFLSLSILSCQSDDSDANLNAAIDSEILILRDFNGNVADTIPAGILKLMAEDYLAEGKQVELDKLKRSYDFRTGKMTELAQTSENYKIKKNQTAHKQNSLQNETPFGYRAYVSNIGWMPYTAIGFPIGTTGLSKSIECIEYIYYPYVICGVGSGHVQSLGWFTQSGCSNKVGTENLGLRLEAVRLSLGGYHRAYVQNIGWMEWVRGAQTAGTENIGARMESYQWTGFY